ncbi:hypothetical protein ACIWO4_05680 [Avibacterium paragallinarum]|uniref:hypothetical protein n=1 Tax=Avibacterium paragallinarum TaxID=728 RepID=UPI0039883448
MQKEIADTIGLMISKELLMSKLEAFPSAGAHQKLAIEFVDFAKALSSELQTNYDEINLPLFQGNQLDS